MLSKTQRNTLRARLMASYTKKLLWYVETGQHEKRRELMAQYNADTLAQSLK